MYNRSDSRNVPQTEEQRLLQLKLRIWSTVAVNLLRKEKNPYVIPDDKIEQHRGRIGKAIKDLGGLVSSAPAKDSTKSYRIHDFETQSADLGGVPRFITTWQEFHDEMFQGYNVSDQGDFDRIGYIMVNRLNKPGVIYVYWHQDEYDFITDKENSVYVYPKALLESRIKAMLRAIVERHYQDDHTAKLERYLGIPEGSLKREDTYNVSVRNYCARAADLSEARYFGDKGFREEYEHYRSYYEALLYNLSQMAALIQEKGGYENIVREMRKASMEELLIDAPLRISYDDKEISRTSIASEEYKVYKNKYPSTFLLRNSGYFDYDTLYASDESVTYIDGGHADLEEGGSFMKKHGFRPDEGELQIIAAYRKDIACSQKNTSIWKRVVVL
jgi:hypothetical protein